MSPKRHRMPHPPAVVKATEDAREAPEPGESLAEAESELGINDWIDPETGEPPEGQSPPRLEED
jgi:hypothetical protein